MWVLIRMGASHMITAEVQAPSRMQRASSRLKSPLLPKGQCIPPHVLPMLLHTTLSFQEVATASTGSTGTGSFSCRGLRGDLLKPPETHCCSRRGDFLLCCAGLAFVGHLLGGPPSVRRQLPQPRPGPPWPGTGACSASSQSLYCKTLRLEDRHPREGTPRDARLLVELHMRRYTICVCSPSELHSRCSSRAARFGYSPWTYRHHKSKLCAQPAAVLTNHTAASATECLLGP